MLRIEPGDLNNSLVVELLKQHVTSARSNTAPGSAHALDLSGLQGADTDFWAAWENDIVLGIGALKRLCDSRGEVKSMYTLEVARGRGVASAMLKHIIRTARIYQMDRLSLETGSWEYFRPAIALYERHGFVRCPPFGNYKADSNSIFLTLQL
jgi:putative acetyltransferase